MDFRAFALGGVVLEKKAEVILLRRKIVEIALQLQLAGRNLFRLMLGLSGQVPRFHHHGAIALFGAEGVLDDFCNSAFPLLHADRSGPVSAGPVRLSGMNDRVAQAEASF